MNRLVSAALVGVLAIGSVAATATTGSADPYYPYHHSYPHYGHGGGYDDGGGYLAAGILGLTAGLVASQVLSPEPPPPPPPYKYYASGYGDEAHIQWCERSYRSYSPETDLWRDYQGIFHRCDAPY